MTAADASFQDYFSSDTSLSAPPGHPETPPSIHPAAWVDQPAHIGMNTSIAPFSHVAAHSHIGAGCTIGHHVTIAAGVVLGQHVTVMDHAHVASGVILDNHVFCGNNTVFMPLHRLRPLALQRQRTHDAIRPTMIRQGATLGPGCAIALGASIGAFAFVEKNTVITENVPPYAIVAGDPMVVVGWRCACGHHLDTPKNQGRKTRSSLMRNSITTVTCGHCTRQYTPDARGHWAAVLGDPRTVTVARPA